jgi:hypothetical protein
LAFVYFEIECGGRWKQRAVNARHSILLPSGRHPNMVIVSFGFGWWLSSEIQSWKELLNQLALFKAIGYRYGYFLPSMNFSLCMKRTMAQ